MTQPRITIQLDGGGRGYRRGDTLSGQYRMLGVAGDRLRAVEVSILWHTDGKGDQDLSIHDFQRLSIEDGDWIDPRQPGRFSTTLPNSPLSYNGAIVKLAWYVRVRVFLSGDEQAVGERKFQLGDIPTPSIVSATP